MKNKKLLLWIIGFVLSIVSFALCFPILLFTFYPYSIVVFSIYAIMVIILSALSFYKKTQSRTIKRMLGLILVIPMIALIAVLISIQVGWLRFPG